MESGIVFPRSGWCVCVPTRRGYSSVAVVFAFTTPGERDRESRKKERGYSAACRDLSRTFIVFYQRLRLKWNQKRTVWVENSAKKRYINTAIESLQSFPQRSPSIESNQVENSSQRGKQDEYQRRPCYWVIDSYLWIVLLMLNKQYFLPIPEWL